MGSKWIGLGVYLIVCVCKPPIIQKSTTNRRLCTRLSCRNKTLMKSTIGTRLLFTMTRCRL